MAETRSPIPVPEPRSNRTLKLKTGVLLTLMVLFATTGNALLDKGMKDLGALDLATPAAIRAGLQRIFFSGTIWIGIICMILFMLCHMLVLSWADFSFVMPFSAAAYALVPLAGVLWLGETVHLGRWIGIALIVSGVVLVSQTPPVTSRPAP